MTNAEVTELLSTLQPYDQRSVGETDVIAWHGALGDLRFEECRDAVLAHYRESTDRVMPAHIRRRVSLARQDRAMRSITTGGDELVPKPDWFNTTRDEYRNRMRALNDQRRERGEPVSYGETVLTASDRMRRSIA